MFFREGAVGGLAGGQEEVCAEGCHFPSGEFFRSQEPITAASDALPLSGRSPGVAAHGPGGAGGGRGGAARAGRCPPALIDTGRAEAGPGGPRCSRPPPPPPPRSPGGIAEPPAAWPARWAGGRRAGGCGARRAAGRRSRREPSPSPGTVRGRPPRWDGSPEVRAGQPRGQLAWDLVWPLGSSGARGSFSPFPSSGCGAPCSQIPPSCALCLLFADAKGEKRCWRAFWHLALIAASLIVFAGSICNLANASEPEKSPRNLFWLS